MSVEIRPAAAWMVEALYGRSIDKTVDALVALDGDRVLGMVGFYPQDARLMLFAHVHDETRAELDRYALTFVRAGHAILKRAKRWGMPVRCWCDTRYPRAEAVLLHFGFQKTNDRDYWEWATTSG